MIRIFINEKGRLIVERTIYSYGSNSNQVNTLVDVDANNCELRLQCNNNDMAFLPLTDYQINQCIALRQDANKARPSTESQKSN